MSFIADKIVMDGLTYDDVLLIPAYSEVLPKTVELTTKFSRNIELKVPFVTAAMDTVTEAKMAIAIAREGGIGVIHKNMSIEEQARQVAIVKRAENGMIYDPVTIKRGSTVRDALALMSEYRIGGIPVVDDERYLVGIVTNRDLRFEKDMDKRIDEVMTKENIVTTNQSTDMEAASRILQEHKIEKLPVVDKEGKLVGLITYKDITKAKDKPMACKDAKGRLRVAAGVAFLFTTFMYMFASLFVAVVHYIYFRYIDGGFVFEAYRSILNQFKETAGPELTTSLNQFEEAIDLLSGLTPLEMTFQLISQNMFYGMLMAIPTALIVMRKKKNE